MRFLVYDKEYLYDIEIYFVIANIANCYIDEAYSYYFELARIEGLNFSQSARRVEGIARNLPKASKSQFLFFEQSGARI